MVKTSLEDDLRRQLASIQEMLAKIGATPDGEPMPLSEFFETVYKPLRLKAASAGGRQQFTIAIDAFGKYLKRPPTLLDLTEDSICGLMSDTVERGLSPVTANMRAKHLLALWRLAKRKGYSLKMGEPDAVDFLREARRLPQAWTVEEMAKLVESSRLARGRFMGVEACKWWPALLLTMYDTGLRRSPAFAIRFDEIDFANKMLRVPAERMKNACEQFFLLHDQTIEAILETLPPRRPLVFPWPFAHHEALYGRFRRILKRAGLPFSKRDLFHKIRRTCATHIARLVGEPMAIQHLGHRDASTIKRYIDPRFTADHSAAKMIPRPGWTNPRQLEVEVTAIEPTPEPLPPITVRFSQADLKGQGEDLLTRLRGQDSISGTELRDALKLLGIPQKDFASEVGISEEWISKVCRERERLSWRLEQRVRSAFGLTLDHDGTGEQLAGCVAKGGAA